MIISCVAVLIHYIIIHGFDILSFPYQVYLLGVGVAIIATVMPSFLMANGIRLIGSSNMAIIASVGPISTIFLSNFILHESISMLHIIGTAFVLTGVLLISLYGNIPKKLKK
jgi:drug/metabolite transporter (DMT)-like permease